MADTAVETNIVNNLDIKTGLWGPYWVDTLKGMIVFADAENDVSFAWTDDAGATPWNTTEIQAGTLHALACWFDQETPGDTGTLVNVAWIDSSGTDKCYYVALNVNDGTKDTVKTVDAGITVDGTSSNNKVAITKTLSGNLIIAFSTQTEKECYQSDDSFDTATKIADVIETATEADWVLLYPANTDDPNDACAIFWDISASEISVKMYDNSVPSWGAETTLSGSMTASTEWINMDGAIRHSDGHILVAAHTFFDDASDDIKTFDVNVDSVTVPVVTAKDDVVTNQNEMAQVAMVINQQNDDVYVGYCKGGTWVGAVDIVYHKSDNDMVAPWDAEQAYSETTDDNRLVHGGRTIGDSGGIVQFSFYNDDLADIYVNLVNDVPIAAAVGGGVVVPIMWHHLNKNMGGT